MKRLIYLSLLFLISILLSGCQHPTALAADAQQSMLSNSSSIAGTSPSNMQQSPLKSEDSKDDPQKPVTPETEPITLLPEPEVPSTWIVNCKQYITLRSAPGGSAITKIPKGKTVELLGWNDKCAKVTYNGRTGYVLSNYIVPEDEGYFTQCLDTIALTDSYTYDQLIQDIYQLKQQYPELMTVSTIGESELGYEIPVIRIGNLDAQRHVLLQGAIHGREHMTAWLLMAMTEYWLNHDIRSYGDICYHIIPMTNPDGVAISQTQTLNEDQRQIYLSDRKRGNTSQKTNEYASRWKANGTGEDINRNFSSGWKSNSSRKAPSSERYKGTEPFSAAEAAALRDYTLSYSFDATISYHATGSILYYEYGRKEPVNSQSKSLAYAVNEVTGYTLADSDDVSGAGYKDWAMDELGIPSLTVEIGVADAPLEFREIYSIFVRNHQVLPAIAQWLQK